MRFKPAKSFVDVLSFPLTDSMRNRIKIMFKLFQSTDEEIEEIQKNVNMYFSNFDDKSENHILFFINLAHYLYVRPTCTKILVKVLSNIRINFVGTFHECTQFCHDNRENPKIEALFDFIYCKYDYKNPIYIDRKTEIEKIIQNDDLEKLQKLIQETSKFDFSCRIKITSHLIKELLTKDNDIGFLELSAFYGSLKCFKFFLQNITIIPRNIDIFIAAGGNIEIYNILSVKHIIYIKQSIYLSVFFHHYKMTDLLLKDFPTFQLSLHECLHCNNEIAFLYFYSNLEIDSIDNKIIKKALYTSIDYPEIDIIKMLFDLRPKLENSELLIKECESPNLSYEILQMFIAYGIDANEVIDGKTPLSVLCSNKYANEKMVQYLIDFGADINLCTPLREAFQCSHPNLSIIKLLIQNGAKLNPNSPELIPQDMLTLAISNNKITDEIIGYIFHLESTKPLSTKQYFQDLYMSRSPNVIYRMFMLLKYGKDCDPKVFNPLHIICAQKVIKESIIYFLVDHGFKLTDEFRKTTPFISLCENSSTPLRLINKFLDMGIDLNQKVNGCTTAEQICKYRSSKPIREDIIQLLVRKGKNIDFSKILYKLCFANMFHDYNAVIRVLNNNLTISPQLYGEIFYHYCESYFLCYDVVQAFISKGANVNQVIEKEPCISTPFTAILLNDKTDYRLKELFIRNSATLNADEICDIAKYKKVNTNTVKFLIDMNHSLLETKFFYKLCCNKNITKEIIKYVLTKGFPLNQGPKTPLLGLCKYNYNKRKIIKYIIEIGAYLNIGNNTPLFYLCKSYDVSCKLVKFFIENGANVNCGQYTPLFAVCTNKYFNRNLFYLLIEKGADPNAGEISAFSSLCKSRYIQKDLIEMMIYHGATMKQTGRESPLLNACQNEMLTYEVLKLLLDKCKEEDYFDEIKEAFKCYLNNKFQIHFDFIKILIQYANMK